MSKHFFDQYDDMYIINEYLAKQAWPELTPEQRVSYADDLAVHELPTHIDYVGVRSHVLVGDDALLASFGDWVDPALAADMIILMLNDPDFADAVADDGLSVFVLSGRNVVKHISAEPERLRKILIELASCTEL
ncbi:MAG: hypothetical protein Q8N35_13220 [Methylococcaceae bacterium]|nr:hypothetical protein [Methylococcaceae bacterium]MDP2395039.1 hypothetical protein [Methylococcaceae bacterium]MDP3020539.1 hypothetical protein [Methylococcaceae bacterium]MDP3389730.1 hypothetical protein [Methylococcaceae bacterium]MDP3932527.1 hypothetical protein [Methylococcaceae bacterium]